MDVILNIANFFQLAVMAKLFLLVLLVFYFIFTIVAYKQITLMTQVLNSSISPAIRLVALFHVGIVVFLFFLPLVLV